MPVYTVPKNIQRTAQRAIEYNNSLPIAQRASYEGTGKDRKPGTGMRTARRLSRGKIDLPQAKLMSAWFARHGESEKEAKARQDRTSKAAIAWALWGGNAGRRWVNSIIRREDG